MAYELYLNKTITKKCNTKKNRLLICDILMEGIGLGTFQNGIIFKMRLTS